MRSYWKSIGAIIGFVTYSGVTHGITFDEAKIDIDGYIKADARFVSGDVEYNDYWVGHGIPLAEGLSTYRMFIKESRFGIRYKDSGFQAYMEADLFGSSTKEIEPRIRHLYVKNEHWLVGHTWSNVMNLHAYPESVSFGGPMNGEAFIRHSQVRLTYHGLSLSLENPEQSENPSRDEVPDFTARYQWNNRFGNLSVATLLTHVKDSSVDEVVNANFLAGRISLGATCDLRLQYSQGNSGRYVSPGLTKYVSETDEASGNASLEEIEAFTAGVQYKFSPLSRMNAYYGYSHAEQQNKRTRHYAINYFATLREDVTLALEAGQFDLAHADRKSDYYQLAFIYAY